jgi:hypothetical protein
MDLVPDLPRISHRFYRQLLCRSESGSSRLQINIALQY